MDERYLTEQERIDNMTMKIENESVMGSGFIQHPPQQRKAPPPHLRDQKQGYNRRGNNYYGGDDRNYPYRPRQRQLRPRHYPPHQNAYQRPPYHDSRGGYYRGQSYHDHQMRYSPRMGHSMGRGPRFEPRMHGPPRSRPDWEYFQRHASGPGRHTPGMRPSHRPNDYRMAHQMQGYVPYYPPPSQPRQPRPAGMQEYGPPRYSGPPNDNQPEAEAEAEAEAEHGPQDPPVPKEEMVVPSTGDAGEIKQN